MDWTPLIGPAVVAAVISGLVSVIGIWISARTSRRIHTEKLSFDRDEAERRFVRDVGVTEAKIKADIELAERRLVLDRALARWKRRTDLAEEVLADFYQARDIIDLVRSPGSFGGEGHTRPREPWEGERDSQLLDSYYRTAERLAAKEEFFSRLMARRYMFAAVFGDAAAAPFLDLWKLRGELLIAVRVLLNLHNAHGAGSASDDRKACEMIIGWRPGPGDEIPGRVQRIVEEIEATCRPAFKESDK